MELKCKSCGAPLNFAEGQLYAKCESCGSTYMIFDFLDRDSEDYEDQMAELKEEQKRFQKTYADYEDDILEADSYCLTAAHFQKIIDFMEKAGGYQNAGKLLVLAKKRFIERISSYEEARLGLQYLEDLPDEETAGIQRDDLRKLAEKYRKEELVAEGCSIRLPKNQTPDSFLKLLRAMKKAGEIEMPEGEEGQWAEQSRQKALQYALQNGEQILSSGPNVAQLREILGLLTELQTQYPALSGLRAAAEEKLQQKLAEERDLLQTRAEEEQRKTDLRRVRKFSWIVILILLVVSLIIAFTTRAKGYSWKNVTVQICAKDNERFNEDLADGYRDAGYFYTFDVQVENHCRSGIDRLRGNMEIFNADGEHLVTTNVDLMGTVEKNENGQGSFRLHMEKGPAARELWNTELKDLTVTFKIRSIEFSNGKCENYSDSRNMIAHAIED